MSDTVRFCPCTGGKECKVFLPTQLGSLLPLVVFVLMVSVLHQMIVMISSAWDKDQWKVYHKCHVDIAGKREWKRKKFTELIYSILGFAESRPALHHH